MNFFTDTDDKSFEIGLLIFSRHFSFLNYVKYIKTFVEREAKFFKIKKICNQLFSAILTFVTSSSNNFHLYHGNVAASAENNNIGFSMSNSANLTKNTFGWLKSSLPVIFS